MVRSAHFSEPFVRWVAGGAGIYVLIRAATAHALATVRLAFDLAAELGASVSTTEPSSEFSERVALTL
jgi:hypothetical protein